MSSPEDDDPTPAYEPQIISLISDDEHDVSVEDNHNATPDADAIDRPTTISCIDVITAGPSYMATVFPRDSWGQKAKKG
jgi:hypothetical protein